MWTPSAKPLTLLSSGVLIVIGKDYLAKLSIASPVQYLCDRSSIHSTSSKQPKDDCSKQQQPDNIPANESDDDEDDEDSALNDLSKTGKSAKDLLPPSTAATKKREKLRELVRQGAPFCGLQLFKIHKTDLPGKLPLPPRLVALDLPITNLDSLIHHLRPPTSVSRSGQASQPTTPGQTPVSSNSRLSMARKDRKDATRKSTPISNSPSGAKKYGTLLTPGWRPRKHY